MKNLLKELEEDIKINQKAVNTGLSVGIKGVVYEDTLKTELEIHQHLSELLKLKELLNTPEFEEFIERQTAHLNGIKVEYDFDCMRYGKEVVNNANIYSDRIKKAQRELWLLTRLKEVAEND